MKPRHVYWEDGTLVAECFVINGLQTPVYNINVEGLIFENGATQIADASFGIMQDAVIAPYSYITWTFYFGPDCIITEGADLSSLLCKYRTSYNY